MSQSLTAVINPIVIIAIIILSNPFSLRNYLLQKIPIMFLCHLHKVFTICYIYEPFCRQNPIFVSQCSQ